MTPYKSAFTVDVECGISLAMRDSYGIDMKPTQRVVSNTVRILELLELKNINGTFFTLGKVAEVFPELIKEIASMGHEIGVHGYNHYEFQLLSPKEAFQELDRSKKLIEDISGIKVFGHRAPAFSINEKTKWVLDIVYEAGFIYDSSVAPIKSHRYGWPDFGDKIQKVKTETGHSIIEVPLKPARFLVWDILVPGGRYFQILPYYLMKKYIENIIQSAPAIFYMHPYEIDNKSYPDYYHKELRKAGLKKNVMTRLKWVNRGSYYKKIEKMIVDFQFTTVHEILKDQKIISTK